jgi:hypothetical protein
VNKTEREETKTEKSQLNKKAWAMQRQELRYTGNQPEAAKSFLIASHKPDAEITWELWEYGLDKQLSDNWRNLKLVILPGAPSKANYWLSWSRAERRLARGKDSALLAEHQPGIRAWIENTMAGLKE